MGDVGVEPDLRFFGVFKLRIFANSDSKDAAFTAELAMKNSKK
jgi:hypothetical protein